MDKSNKYEGLSIQELRALCKRKNIPVNNTDSKEVLRQKLIEYDNKDLNRVNRVDAVRNKFKNKRKVIVTKLDPDDIRNSVLITITNTTGSYRFIVPFNVEVELPEPVIKNLLNTKYQKWVSENHPLLGTIDVSYMTDKYHVQFLD